MGFSFSFVLKQKKKKQKEKFKAERLRGYCGKAVLVPWSQTRFVSLRSNKASQHRPSIPPLTPLRLGRSFISNGFFIRQGASLLAFCFWLRLWLSLYDFWGKICIHKNLLENGLKKECEFLKTIRILQACNSHIADWLLEYFFIFLVFFFIPSRRCCRADFFELFMGCILQTENLASFY